MKTLPMNRRQATAPAPERGFTLVELLVVIAIIGVLVALLLPAIQATREAARRASCLNNISQLALAIHNYEFSMEYFPAGVINPEGPIRSEPEGQHISWIVQILPHIEQRNAYRILDQEAGAYAGSNSDVREVVLSVVVCPSFPGADVNELERLGDTAISNYAGCHHHVEAPIDEDNTGVLFLNSRIRFSDIHDGSSQTLMVGELIADKRTLGWVSGTRATLRNTGAFDIRGYREIDQAHEKDGIAPLEVGGFSSFHPSAANFAFADGSCRALREDINPEVFQQLGHRADGKLLKSMY